VTNPISSLTPAAFPPISFPITDPVSGGVALWWYRSFLAIYERTGGAAGTSINDVVVAAIQVLAQQADATAALALSDAAAAQASAGTANSLAQSVQNTANAAWSLANTIQSSALLVANNLSDLQTPSIARGNLGLSVVPITLSISGAPTPGGVLYVPILQALTIPTNFAGTQTFCGTAPTTANSATYTVDFLRSTGVGGTAANVSTAIGVIRLTPGSSTLHTMLGVATSLQPGDVLRLTQPASLDATLSDVGITLKLTL
jgi:hypothetical protein